MSRSPRGWSPWLELSGLFLGIILCVIGLGKHLHAPSAISAPPPESDQVSTADVETPVEISENPTRGLPANLTVSAAATELATIKHPPRLVTTSAGENVLFYDGSYALVIGISDYEDPHLPDLPGVKTDIDRVSNALELHGFEVTKVLNPSRDQMQVAYTNFVNEYGQNPTQKNNRLLFYFAGHGINLPGADGRPDGFLVGRDAPNKSADIQGFRRESYPLRNIHNLAEDILTKHALFIFDSCFSGSLFTQQRAVIPPAVAEKMAQPVRQFITSGSAEQEVPDQSIFCELLVDALTNGTADQLSPDTYMTGSDLSRYLADEVKKRSGGGQTPQYGKDSRSFLAQGDFIFTLNPDLVAKPGTTRIEDMTQGTSPSARPFDPNSNGFSAAPDISEKTEIHLGLDFENSLGMRFRRVNPNHFKITDVVASAQASEQLKEGRIELEEPVWMGLYEVNQDFYQMIVGENPSKNKNPLNPVTNVSWKEAMNFCRELNGYEARKGFLPDGYEYRLPWEAEWELANYGVEGAARQDDFSGSQWWEASIDQSQLQPVGRGASNSRGFHDMNKNVLEWCGDAFIPGIPAEEQTAPRGPFSADTQVVRGASSNGASLRIGAFDSYFRAPYIGFRVVLARKEPEVDRNVPQGLDFFQLSQLFTGTEYESSGLSLKKFVLEIAQRRMAHNGYYEGTADGSTGANTQTAINDFQWVNRLAVTGTIDTPTLNRLKLVGITDDDVKKGAETYIQRTGGWGSQQGSGSSGSGKSEWKETSDEVADEIVKWSRVRNAVGISGGLPFSR